MRVGFFVFPGVTLLDVTGPAEVLGRAGYELVMLSPQGGSITSGSGLPIAGTLPVAPEVVGPLDTVVVCGADDLPDQPWAPGLIEAASAAIAGRRRVASVCTGAFILAELGLLDGRRATTHWRYGRELARRYPLVRVEPDALHVRDGRFVSSAGITAGIDLALSLVEEDLGADVARDIAREIVMFMHRPAGQSQFAGEPPLHSGGSPIVQAVIATVQMDPAGAHTVASLAEVAAVSTRHLGRLFRDELGTTPARWLEQFRLGRAQRHILDGLTISAAARHSGFGTDENLRRAFERRLKVTPSDYRTRFTSTRPLSDVRTG